MWRCPIRVTESHLTDEAHAMNACAIKMHANHFWTAHKPIWCLNCSYLNPDTHMNVPVSVPASRSCIMTKLPIKLYISNTTTVLHGQKQSWEIIQTRCDQLAGPHGSCQILCCWYTSQPPCSPVSQKSEE